MKKQTKLAVGLSAAALLAIGASMTSFAATRGWVQEGDDWYYYDNSGDYVTDKWKTYNGQYFYLGDDGIMLKDQLIEDGDNYYYVDANGVMIKNQWIAIAADEDETEDVDYRWYYFTSTGKAYKSNGSVSFKTINGKKYLFDEEAKMLFGYIDADGTSINDDTDAILNCKYYLGTNDDGARYSGWLRYNDSFDTVDYDDYDYEYYWFNFKSNGQKRDGGKTASINGQKYYFDEHGVMLTEWAEGESQAKAQYFSGSIEDGSLKKNAWIQAVPDESWGQGEDEEWFRTTSNGSLVLDQTKKINGKWYVFNEYGIMESGLIHLGKETVVGAKLDSDTIKNNENKSITGSDGDKVGKFDLDLTTAEDIYGLNDSNIYYFSSSDSDGSMKTGYSINISLADDDYTFGFNKSTGKALTGVQNKKVYRNGILQKASDDKYAVVLGGSAENGFKVYLVNNVGTVMKTEGKYYKDDNDEYYVVGDGTDAAGYEIYKAADVDVAKVYSKKIKGQDLDDDEEQILTDNPMEALDVDSMGD